jgi:hypothetical protein
MMRQRNNFLLLGLSIGLTISVNSLFAQKAAISDSVWCDHLNEIIKCASTDEISERMASLADSAYIPPFTPALRLSTSYVELIRKEYNKVSYIGYLYSGNKIDDKFEKHFTEWYLKIKDCLTLWQIARLKNSDSTLSVPDDYFFTNDEDETSVRLDIIRDKGYQVRLRVF